MEANSTALVCSPKAKSILTLQFFIFCPSHADVDECERNEDSCHENAQCINTEGSYTCSCNPGYTGDGINCTSKLYIVTFCTIMVQDSSTVVCESSLCQCTHIYLPVYILQMSMSVNWRYIHAIPMLTALTQMVASTAHAGKALKAMGTTVQVHTIHMPHKHHCVHKYCAHA